MDQGDIQNNSTMVTPNPIPKKKFLLAVFGLIFLLVIFLVPLTIFIGVPSLFYVSKLAVISILAGVSIILVLLNILKTGELEFPQSKIIFALVIIPIVAVISSFFSGNLANSIGGNVLEIGTAGSIIIFAIIFFLSVIAGSKKVRIKRAIITFLISMGIAVVYTGVITSLKYYGVQAILGGLLPTNPIGNYIDFSILLSVAIIFCIYFLNFSGFSKKINILLWALIVLSLLIIGATGFQTLNIMLGTVALLLFIFKVTISKGDKGFWGTKSYSALVVLLTSILFIFAGNSVSGYLSNILKVDSLDVRPNIEVTFNIIKHQWEKNIVTGSGPNKFVELFALYKPLTINDGVFWNADFSYGFGLLPTLFATTGLLGLVSIVFFLLLFIKKGLGTLWIRKESPSIANSRFMSVFLFSGSIFLWISTMFYIPSISVLTFTFVFSGLFVASLVHAGSAKHVRINLFGTPLVKFISVFFIVLLMVITISSEYFVWRKIVASVIFNKAVVTFNIDADILKAQNSIARANNIESSDLYERGEAELYLLNIEKIVSGAQANSNITENQKTELQNAVAEALKFAKVAIAKNPTNYQNYITLARIYESLAGKGVAGAGDNAKSSYTEALKLNPNNPSIQLGLARIAAFSGDTTLARTYINKAIELKRNYTDAYFIMAQLEAASNNVPGVIKAIEGAITIDSSNSGLYFQLGLVKYQIKDNAGAVVALEKALSIIPDYANAQYFLGLTYNNLGRKGDAIKQFENLRKTNPNNQEVVFILGNLQGGRDPFFKAKPPIDSKPEKRTSPPIKE